MGGVFLGHSQVSTKCVCVSATGISMIPLPKGLGGLRSFFFLGKHPHPCQLNMVSTAQPSEHTGGCNPRPPISQTQNTLHNSIVC